ncbi:hypothetical protein ABZ746_06305 [Streptomyces sp. NPDC020096]
MHTGDESPGMWCAVERRAVSWLAAHRTRFDPETADQAGVLFARKALVEVALLVGLRARMDPAPFDRRYQQLLDLVTTVARRPSYRELVARDEPALLLYAGTYAALRLCGHRDVEFRQLIEQSVAGRYAACFERIPYRQLDLLHTLELSGVDHGMTRVDAVLPFTLLCADPSVVKLRDRDIYAITHTVFYATDFGLRAPRWPTGFKKDRAVELLEALSVLSRQRENADLVAELLCSLMCLGIRGSSEVERAWQFLAGVQEPDGRVAGPDGIVHPELASTEEEYRNWATGYHTTIVTALAGLLTRSPDIVRRPCPTPTAASPDGRLEAAVRRATTWLAANAVDAPLDEAIPAAAAAVRGAHSVGEPQLASRALASVAHRAETEPGPTVWTRHSADVVFECARGMAASDLACTSLDRFLADIAAALTGLTTVPANAAGGVVRLMELGWLTPEQADFLLASSDPADLLTEDHPPAVTAKALARYAGDEPRRLGRGSAARSRVAERLAAALPTACQSYKLEEAAALLRGLALLGWADHRITRDGLGFLLSQQAPTGAFGYPAHDDHHVRTALQRNWTQSCTAALSSLFQLRHDAEVMQRS